VDGGDKPHFHTKIACISVLMQAICLKSLNHDRLTNPSINADISPDGKAKEWPLYDLKDKQVMVFDEFDIHPAKEADVKIVDWDRTYFLTKYYGF